MFYANATLKQSGRIASMNPEDDGSKDLSVMRSQYTIQTIVNTSQLRAKMFRTGKYNEIIRECQVFCPLMKYFVLYRLMMGIKASDLECKKVVILIIHRIESLFINYEHIKFYLYQRNKIILIFIKLNAKYFVVSIFSIDFAMFYNHSRVLVSSAFFIDMVEVNDDR